MSVFHWLTTLKFEVNDSYSIKQAFGRKEVYEKEIYLDVLEAYHSLVPLPIRI